MRELVNYLVKIIKRNDWIVNNFFETLNLMKTFYKLAVLGALLLVTQVESQAQILLSYWNFNNDSPTYVSGNLGSFNTTAATYGEQYTTDQVSSNTANGTVYHGSNIFLDFSNLSVVTGSNPTPIINGKVGGSQGSTVGGQGGAGTFSDSGLNAVAGDTSTKQGSVLIMNPSGNENGRYITLDLDTLGYNNLTLTYAGRSSSGFTTTNAFSYSTDGINFSSLTTLTVNTGGVWTGESVNLSSLSANATDNLSTLYVRITLNSIANGGSFGFDNIQLTGTAIAVPEPSTYALMGLGLLGLVFCLRIRSQRQV